MLNTKYYSNNNWPFVFYVDDCFTLNYPSGGRGFSYTNMWNTGNGFCNKYYSKYFDTNLIYGAS